MVLRLIAITAGFALLLSCGGITESNKTISGAELYQSNCASCHGGDGKLKAAGAKDLSISMMSDEECTLIIRNGRGGMRAFGNELSEAEIKAVVEHVKTLRK